MEFRVGDEVMWRSQPRGGYGYIVAVPASVIGFTQKRVRILAQLRNGGEKQLTVREQNLRRHV